MGNLIAFAVGAAIGSALTAVLLSPENLRKYQKVSNDVSNSYAVAKAVYKSEVYGNENEESEDEKS